MIVPTLRDTRPSCIRPGRPLVAVGFFALAALVLHTPGQAAAADSPQFSFVTATGEVTEGRLISLDNAVTVAGEDGQSQRLERSGVAVLRQTDRPAEVDDSRPLVLLVNGDVLYGKPGQISEDALSLEWTGTEPPLALSVPLEFVRSVVLAQPGEDIQRQRLQRQWAVGKPAADRLFLRNTTHVDGEFTEADDQQVVVATRLGTVRTPRGDVAALALSAELAAETTTPDEYAILICVDGSRITLLEPTVAETPVIAGGTQFGGQIEVPLERVARVGLFSDRVQSLAEREPAEYVFTPYLTEQRPLVQHRNVYGGPLRLRGTVYPTGLGMHSRSDVTYDLREGGFRWFTATIGVDDMADGQGHVVFRVLVGGTTVYESPGVTGRSQPLEVGPLDISAAGELTLSVDFGRAGNIRDIANWCDPLLIK